MLTRVLRWVDLVACLVIAGLAVQYGARTPVWYAGLLLTVLSTPLWIIARAQLGESFSVRPEARALVTTGFYSKIRHPVYLFGTLAYFGAFLALQIWWILGIWLALTPLEIVRARQEDSVLAKAFGAQYASYRSRTWF